MNVITIIPAYNEEKTIKNIVNCALKYSNVLVVDDGSTDDTSILAKDAGAKVIKHDQNRGKGAAIKTGLKEALYNDYQVIVLLDGDGQHDPHCIPQLVSYIGNAGIVIGSRFKDGAPEGMPLLRKLSNTITTHFIRYITGYQITDSQCGFRAISSHVVRFFLDIQSDDYVYESEVLYHASLNNIKVKEKPVPSTYCNEKSYVTWKNVINYFLFILRIIIRKYIRRI